MNKAHGCINVKRTYNGGSTLFGVSPELDDQDMYQLTIKFAEYESNNRGHVRLNPTENIVKVYIDKQSFINMLARNNTIEVYPVTIARIGEEHVKDKAEPYIPPIQIKANELKDKIDDITNDHQLDKIDELVKSMKPSKVKYDEFSMLVNRIKRLLNDNIKHGLQEVINELEELVLKKDDYED